jgi:hypothetical protein
MGSAIAQEDHAQRLTGKSIDLVLPNAFSLFFVFGSITSLNDVLMAAFKELFALNQQGLKLLINGVGLTASCCTSCCDTPTSRPIIWPWRRPKSG